MLLPPKSPNLNSYLARLMRSLKSEFLCKMIFFGQKSLEHALKEYVAHYHSERNHQGLENQLIDPDDEVGSTDGTLKKPRAFGRPVQLLLSRRGMRPFDKPKLRNIRLATGARRPSFLPEKQLTGDPAAPHFG